MTAQTPMQLHGTSSGELTPDNGIAMQAVPAGSRLHFEFYEQEGGDTAGGVRVIDLKRVDKYTESEHEILFQLVKQFNVPENLRCAVWVPH